MIVYLVRHGQTTSDLEDRYGGDYDDHLTELGCQQSSEVARKLSSFGAEIIYSSPKIRAHETAKIIKDKVPVPLVIVPDFRERNRYGVLSGLTKSEAMQTYPDQVELLADEHVTLRGGEDYQSFGARIRSALDKIDTGKYQKVIVVTHGGPIRYIFREVLKEGEIEIGDCAYANLETKNGKLALLDLNGIQLKT
jgi:broad specificity phosphatase PhoE